MEQEGSEPGRYPGLSCLCEEWRPGSEIWADLGVTQTLDWLGSLGCFRPEVSVGIGRRKGNRGVGF